MRQLPATLEAVTDAVVDVLATAGTTAVTDLIDTLDSSDLHLGAPAESVLEELDMGDRLVLVATLAGGRWAWLPRLFEGRALTHRLTAMEIDNDVVAGEADLDPAFMLADDATFLPPHRGATLQRFADGTPFLTGDPDLDGDLDDEDAPHRAPEHGADFLLLPRGYLSDLGAQPGDLVSLTLTPDGWVLAHLPAGTPVGDPGRHRTAVRTWLDGMGPTDVPDLVWWLLDTTDAFTTPELPLSELFTAWGLTRRSDIVALNDVDLEAWAQQNRARSIAERHRIGDDDAHRVARLLGLVDRADAAITAVLRSAGTGDGDPGPSSAPTGPLVPPTDEVADLTAPLVDPDVAEAFLTEAVGIGKRRAAALGLLAENLQPVAPRSVQPMLHWLVGKAYEHTGDPLRAEASLRAAADLAPWPPALTALARYSSDRGHAAEAAALLRRAGVSRDDAELAVYEHFARMSATNLGRNQPCWCGSGRKYKVCHLGKETLPLSERAAWLYQKAGAYAAEGRWRGQIVEAAAERARYAATERAFYEALHDGLVVDAVLVEGGAFEAFLAERGLLLPDDELALGEQWLLVDRSVHEVEAVRPGTGITLRDIRTGDVHTVRERTASRTVEPGMLLCARVLPAGDTMQVFGPVEPVRLSDLDALLALLDLGPRPAQLVSLLSRRFAPPQVQNTDGEALVFHEAEFRVADPERLAAHLDSVLGADNDEPVGSSTPKTWHVLTDDGMDRVRASVRLDGDVVTVETNSDARYEETIATLQHAGTTITEISHEHHTAEEMSELLDRFPDLLGAPSPLADADEYPEVADAIAGMMRRYEDQWLDEPIPALGGSTPRQAVADPTRRGDVVRLLRSWPVPTPQSMDRDRIAGLLGLTL